MALWVECDISVSLSISHKKKQRKNHKFHHGYNALEVPTSIRRMPTVELNRIELIRILCCFFLLLSDCDVQYFKTKKFGWPKSSFTVKAAREFWHLCDARFVTDSQTNETLRFCYVCIYERNWLLIQRSLHSAQKMAEKLQRKFFFVENCLVSITVLFNL